MCERRKRTSCRNAQLESSHSESRACSYQVPVRFGDHGQGLGPYCVDLSYEGSGVIPGGNGHSGSHQKRKHRVASAVDAERGRV